MTRNWPCFRWNSAWRRLTVMSSRKMPLSGWRPADVTGWSSKNREPALGPRVTMSSAEPLGNPSTSHIASPALAGAAASSSPRKSSRKAEVVSAATSSGGPSLSIRLTCCSLLANRQDQLCLTTKRDETNCPENVGIPWTAVDPGERVGSVYGSEGWEFESLRARAGQRCFPSLCVDGTFGTSITLQGGSRRDRA